MRSRLKVRGSSSRRSRFLWSAFIVLALAVIPVLPVAALTHPMQEINSAGFGDQQNSFSWSMAWFKGKLYVGTVRNELCVEGATLDFFFPGKGYYNTHPDPDMTCPPSPYDLNLQAEIWQYTPNVRANQAWKRVFQSPADIPNPRAPGKFVARDIGFRGMVVYTDSDGHEALYVGGVTADEYIPEIAASHPPRILRTTDGETFTPIPGAPAIINTTTGAQRPIGYRAMIVYDGRLFVTASGGLTGDGVVIEVGNPSGANPTFTQVSPVGIQAYEMDVFNDHLYVGAGDPKTGYSVWKTAATGSAPYQFIPVVTDGAGRGPAISSVVSMHVFQNQLYIGASGWYSTLFPASELIRINPDDSWDLVVGNSRLTAQGNVSPVSGLPDGFGNIFNAHFWRMDDFLGAIYVGTNDWSWALHTVPWLSPFFQFQYGFDVYGSCDGNHWFLGTQNAFGDGLYNFGARTMASTPAGAFLGSANHVQGTRVWGGSNLSVCRGMNPRIAGVDSIDVTAPPAELQADVQSCGTVLSWDSTPGVQQYHILRAEYRPNSTIGTPAPPKFSKLPNDLPLLFPNPAGSRTIPSNASIMGNFTEIGATSQTSFVDSSAKPGVRYAYQVVADYGQNALSGPSNLVVVPSEAPPVTFDSMSTEIQNLADQGKVDGSTAESMQSDLSRAHTAASNGDRTGAAQILQNLRQETNQSSGQTITTGAAKNLQPMLLRLQRSTNFDNTACTSTGPNDGGSPSPSPSPSSNPQSSTSPSPPPSTPPSSSPSPPSGSSGSFFDLLRSIWGNSGTSGVMGRNV